MRSLAIGLVFCSAALLLTGGRLEAKIHKVPQDTENVGMALREAAYGDTVLVSPGKYRVHGGVRSGVVVMSSDGPDSTILWSDVGHILKLRDCDMATVISGFTFDGKECDICLACSTGAPVIEGNVITRSLDGIALDRSNALISNNTIRGCTRGLYMDRSDPEVIDNAFVNNLNGISIVSSSPVIARCRFERNGRGIMIQGHSYPTIGGSLDKANTIIGKGYSIYNAGLRIEDNLFTDKREVAVATYNYWGSLCPDPQKMRGPVVFKPWTDAKAETTYQECPEEEAVEESGSR